MNLVHLKNSIFKINSDEEFEQLALEIFKYQFNNNSVYNEFVNLLNIDVSKIDSTEKIPFLPIELFKSREVKADKKKVEKIFSSSGTTGMTPSLHKVVDLKLYRESYIKAFEKYYGKIENLTILGLLPSYLERDGSSLIYMVDDLIKKSKSEYSGFYLNNHQELYEVLTLLEEQNKKTVLIGVSFGLLDFVEKYNLKLKSTIVMETGGMKGRRVELLREELHKILKKGFGVDKIHSEYGMTELLSQAYSKGDGVFESPSWMKILLRDTEDPMTILKGGSGAINVIDLANIESCSFIATQDLGKINNKGFEIIGRFDHSDVRGCNLMVL